jgi:FKBP-type peptidyl-prolyl cis-trans isomerase
VTLRQMINKTIFRPTLAILAGSFFLSFSSSKLSAEEETTSPDQATYEAIGMMIAHGSGLHKMGFSEAQIQAILAGLKKGFVLQEMTDEAKALQPKVQAIMMQKMQAVRQAQQAEMAQAAEANKAKAKEFFTLLATQQGVLKDPSGFYYEILQKGEGKSPKMSDTVKLHYHGTLIDGTVFDSSVDRGQPASFPMSGVIKGFSGGLTKTQIGGKVRIYIPSELGYGDNPRPGGKIKPGDALIFECELLEIQ